MNFIDELLKDEKVEWKTIGDIIERYSEKAQYNKDIKIVYTISKDYGIIPSLEYWNDKEQKNNYQIYSEDTGNYNVIRENMFAYNPARLNIGSIDCLFNKEPGLLSPMYVIFKIDEKKIMAKYLLLYLKSSKVLQKIDSIKEPGARFRFDFKRWNKIEIPLPSLETQKKVLRILDNFTKYGTELEKELQARYDQYNYYRDMLLSEEYLNKISEKFTENQFIEWKMLGELFEFKNGLNKGKNFFGKGTPIINYMDVYKRNKIYSDDLRGLVETTEDEQKRYSIKRGDVFFTRTSETKEEIGKTSVLLDDVEKGVFSGFVLRARPITELLLPEYCAYCFETYEFRKNVIRYSTYTTRALTNGTTLSNLEIPVPPIEIQNKIVKILDRFQELLSDTKGLLPLEIEQRRKQYEYYREKLLTFGKEEGYALSTAQQEITSNFFELLKEAAKIADIDVSDKVEWKTLGEISVGNLTYGSGASAIEYDGEVRYVRITDIDTNGNLKEEKFSPSEIEEKYFLNYGDILFARSGATVGKNYIHQSGEKSVYAGYLIRLIVNQKLALPKYIYYYINSTEYFKFVENTKSNGSQPNINAKQYSDFKIPLPPLPVQEYIVSILDKFDALVNDLSQGLPKEIELRQKQYEYYREKLLNFEK